ncbi:hypothetical protein GCM10020220_025960 [Nonomuraea rubra]
MLCDRRRAPPRHYDRVFLIAGPGPRPAHRWQVSAPAATAPERPDPSVSALPVGTIEAFPGRVALFGWGHLTREEETGTGDRLVVAMDGHFGVG